MHACKSTRHGSSLLAKKKDMEVVGLVLIIWRGKIRLGPYFVVSRINMIYFFSLFGLK